MSAVRRGGGRRGGGRRRGGRRGGERREEREGGVGERWKGREVDGMLEEY